MRNEYTNEEKLKAVILGYVRSARFVEYSPGTGPHAPGYWLPIHGGLDGIEIGASRYSSNPAIATRNYQIEVVDLNFKNPLIVYRKNSRPYNQVSDIHELDTILHQMVSSIPEDLIEQNLQIYGQSVKNEDVLNQEEPESRSYFGLSR